MYHLVVIFVVVCMSGLEWMLIRSAPRVLSMVLPARLAYGIGATLLILGLFLAFGSAHVAHSAPAMISAILQSYVGLWFVLAPSSAQRGTYSDDQMLRQLFTMIGLLLATLIASLYLKDQRVVGLMIVALVASGLWLTNRFLRTLDGSR
jgi:hypothetical protein